jgi:uncharacterized repeat protein (TIGR03843 family)
MTEASDLGAELSVTGRITTASNGTYLGALGDTVVVYKPVSGERPLWDFPDGTLASREVAAYLVSEAFAWDVVPRTWLRDGPFGPGSVQLWREPDPAQDAVDLVPGNTPIGDGWLRVLDGTDESDRPVSLVHEDTAVLRRMAVFDVVVNNADRKGAHILEMPGGHRYGVDHGLTFHAEHKLRTVLWGWIGEELRTDELDGIRRVRAALDADLGYELAGLIQAEELDELAARCDRLVASARFPQPHPGMPAVPWPLF